MAQFTRNFWKFIKYLLIYYLLRAIQLQLELSYKDITHANNALFYARRLMNIQKFLNGESRRIMKDLMPCLPAYLLPCQNLLNNLKRSN